LLIGEIAPGGECLISTRAHTTNDSLCVRVSLFPEEDLALAQIATHCVISQVEREVIYLGSETGAQAALERYADFGQGYLIAKVVYQG
jgi:hypothetical protein